MQAVYHAAAILHLHAVEYLPHAAHIRLRGLHAEIAAEHIADALGVHGAVLTGIVGIAPVVMDAGVDDLAGERREDLIQFDVYYCCALIGMAAGQIDEDTSELKDLVEKYPVQYRDCKAQIAGLLVASEARRLGIDTQSPKLEQIMLQYLSNNDTLLSEDGIKTLNAYALKGYRLITDYPLFDKPTSREEFLDAFNVAMQFYEKKDS